MKLLKLVPDDTNIDFLQMARDGLCAQPGADGGLGRSGCTKGLNFGVDFIGGQMIRATFTQSADGAGCRTAQARLQRLAMANRPSSGSARKTRFRSA